MRQGTDKQLRFTLLVLQLLRCREDGLVLLLVGFFFFFKGTYKTLTTGLKRWLSS